MSSTTEIANLAISHLGIGKEIQNLDTDNSEEAVACRRYFETSLKAVFRAYNWSFANRIATLNLVETNPNNEWTYSYRYPSDALKLIKIQSGTRIESKGTRVVYKLSGDDTAKLILTDEVNQARHGFAVYSTATTERIFLTSGLIVILGPAIASAILLAPLLLLVMKKQWSNAASWKPVINYTLSAIFGAVS